MTHATEFLEFAAWSQNRAEARFTDWLRESAQPTWDETINHRFTEELADGTLNPKVMARYLIQDYTFLDAFVVLVSSAIATARTLPDRIPMCQFLGLVTGDEDTYFQRSFEALGVSEEERINTRLESVTVSFQDIMREAADTGTYTNMIAVLTVAEWSYLSWANRVKDRRPDQFWLHEWIDLHSGDDFERFVAFLRGQLDRDGPTLTAAERVECKNFFTRAVGLEKAFFVMAYEA